MKIKKITLNEISIPMKLSLSTAQAVRRRSDNLILKMEFDNGIISFGESIPRSYVTGETNASVFAAFKEKFSPRLIGFEINTLEDICQKMKELDKAVNQNSNIFHGAALCAVDLALLDGLGKFTHKSIPILLNRRIEREAIPYTLGMDLSGDTHFEEKLEIIKGYNFKSFKVKVGRSREEDLIMLKNIRERFGDALDIRVDANCSWGVEEAIEILRQMEEYNISCVEQPILQGDMEGLKKVKENVAPLIIADESACSFYDVEKLIEKDACDLINIKISKCGGLINSLKIADYVNRNGKGCILGAQAAETGILESAGRTFGIMAKDVRYFEGSVSNFIFAETIVIEDLSFNRDCLAYPLTGPGLGITIDEEMLRKFEVRKVDE